MHLSNKHVQTIQEFLQEKGFIYGAIESGVWCPVTQNGYTQYSIRLGIDPVTSSLQPNNIDALPQVFRDLVDGNLEENTESEVIEEVGESATDVELTEPVEPEVIDGISSEDATDEVSSDETTIEEIDENPAKNKRKSSKAT